MAVDGRAMPIWPRVSKPRLPNKLEQPDEPSP